MFDVGEKREKLDDFGQHVKTPEQQGSRDHEFAERRDEFADGVALLLFDQIENPPRGRDIADTGIRQRQLARRTLQQLRAQLFFEIGDFSRERRDRHAHFACRRGEAALFDCDEQHAHGFKTVQS
jgi:hypothetical protein